MNTYELNIDGLVGPTHHYAGLSAGNMASTRNALNTSNPAAAALQGLQKMRLLHQLGIKQAIMPPHPRPNIALLHQLGFSGTPENAIQQAYRVAPELLSACYSASSMWTANAATVTPSTDTLDHRVHFTAANLISNLHRHQEAPFSYNLLKRLFADEQHYQHHLPVPSNLITRDEGAANHNRLASAHGKPGLHLFVYNQQMLPPANPTPKPQRHPARQTREASEVIIRNHQLKPESVVMAQQNPDVVDQGVFHNDVISVANEYVLLIHEDAFLNQADVYAQIQRHTTVHLIEVPRNRISVRAAVESYLFNSQLITLANGNMALIAPIECQQDRNINAYIHEIIKDESNPINQVHFLDLKQSMRNGGGPACLRLRVVLNEQELHAMHAGVLITEPLLTTLEQWVHRHYRTELTIADLADPALMHESFTALDELTTILQLSSIYSFQSFHYK